MPTLPLDLVKELLRLINNIIEVGREDPTATARYLTAFWIFWPLAKPFLAEDQEKQIEAWVRGIQAPAPPKPVA